MTSPALRPSAPVARRRAGWLGFALVFFATLGVYLPSLANGFVWDDQALVLRDPLIRSWRLGSEGFDHFLFLDATGSNFYRPLQRLTYIFDYQFFFFDPWGYHLSSIVLHALSAGALFLMARAFMARFSPAGIATFWPALATALIWAVHPLHTSAVTYVSGRADPLAALFCFLGLTVALNALRNPLVNWREFMAGLCFLLAAFSKELGIISFGLWLITLAWARASTARLITAVVISASALGVYTFMRMKAERLDPPPATPSAIWSGRRWRPRRSANTRNWRFTRGRCGWNAGSSAGQRRKRRPMRPFFKLRRPDGLRWEQESSGCSRSG